MTTPEKDQELWFDDGSVVLIAGGTAAFRVYKGLLARASPIFRDMFSTGQRVEDEFMDGCPVVHVHDSPTDLRHFLRVVFLSGTDSLRMPPKLIPFASIASTIRIAHKYQAEDIIDAAASRLEHLFVPPQAPAPAPSPSPSSDSPPQPDQGHWLDSPLGWKDRWELGQKQSGVSMDLSDAIAAVNLARLLDRPRLLPIALYLCCLGDVLHLRNGVPREDGDESTIVERLSDEDYKRCVLALPALTRETHAVIRAAVLSPSGKIVLNEWCTHTCKGFLDILLRQHADAPEVPYAISDLLVPVLHWATPSQAFVQCSQRMCERCRARLLDRSKKACVNVREKFPHIFTLT